MLTPEQQRAAHAPGHVIVTAGAGSGKTFLLSERYLELVGRGLSPLEIVATTFTRKAAAELKARVRARMRAPGLEPETIAELEAAQISTLDALAARVCRDFPLEAELPADVRVLDEDEEKEFRAHYLDMALATAPEHCFDTFGYSELKGYVEQLLFDPLTAETALTKGSEDWEILARQVRQDARAQLLETTKPQLNILRNLQGPDGDAREEARLQAITGLEQIKASNADDTPTRAYDMLKAISLKGGSKKKWGDAAFTQVSVALSEVRKALKNNYNNLTLQLGEADELLEQLLPALRNAFTAAQTFLREQRKKDRVVDFANLEVHALKALTSPHVQDHYQQRFKAYLIDELQDTNPVQADFIRTLAGDATLTLVGDVKQSIYGFRRADASVFHRFREQILASGGEEVVLDTSFRTHNGLLEPLNTLTGFLGDLHQPLRAARKTLAVNTPFLEAYCLSDAAGSKEELRAQEAQLIALRLQRLIAKQTLVQDEAGERPVRPADIAIIAAEKAPLKLYADALDRAGLPHILSDTDDLLGTREAQDGMALLRFLADPADDLATLALLRSPYFGLSDRTLQRAALTKESSWYAHLQTLDKPMFEPARSLLSELADKRKRLPTDLFDLAEKRTAYPAILANLPGSARRVADYRAFCELVRELEADSFNAFSVWRDIRDRLAREVNVPRPSLSAGDAITLINTHKAKGLEWRVVVAADLGNIRYPRAKPLYTSRAGTALSLKKRTATKTNPVLYEALHRERLARENAEAKRLLYVTLTRARDYLFLTASELPDPSKACAAQLLDTSFKPLSSAQIAAGLQRA